jgi:hypothetical protein
MPSNQSIDDQFGVLADFFSSLASRVVAVFGPLTLSFLVWVMESWASLLRQTTRIIQAIQDSFKNDTIIFYQESNIYYPSVEKEHALRKFMIGDAKWVYRVAENLFVNLDTSGGEFRTHSIPFLGASVSRTVDHSTHFLGDLSEWILDQTVWSNSEDVPFQVIVAAWAYCHRISLHYNYPGHTFTVMTMDGDEKMFDLQSGQELMEELRLPPSPTDETSGEESESSLEEGEIPMPHRESELKEE